LPDLRVVSDNPEIEKRKAALPIKFALIALTTNLLRIVRGAGKPDLMVDQIDGLMEVLNEYLKVYRQNPDPELIAELLRFDPEERPSDDRFDEALSENAICRHALQVVASTLLDNKLQRDKATSDYRACLGAFVDMRERRKRRRRLKRKEE
jgi:hypothetical protein